MRDLGKRALTIAVLITIIFGSLIVAQATTKTITVLEINNQGEINDVVYLNGQPIKNNEIILAKPENQEELIRKYGLTKPSENAKLVSVRIVLDPNDLAQSDSKSNGKTKFPFIFGYRLVKEPANFINGWTEIARNKYFCNRPSTDQCSDISIHVTSNQQVSTEVITSFGVGYEGIISAEFGYSEGETVGVSTTVVASAPDIPGGRTFIAIGYPIYRVHFFKFYERGLISDKLLGTGTFMEPLPLSIAVTDWIQ